jgi:hypothetical protein
MGSAFQAVAVYYFAVLMLRGWCSMNGKNLNFGDWARFDFLYCLRGHFHVSGMLLFVAMSAALNLFKVYTAACFFADVTTSPYLEAVKNLPFLPKDKDAQLTWQGTLAPYNSACTLICAANMMFHQRQILQHAEETGDRSLRGHATLARKFHCTRMLILVSNLQPVILAKIAAIQNADGLTGLLGKAHGMLHHVLGDWQISKVHIILLNSMLMCYWTGIVAMVNWWSWRHELSGGLWVSHRVDSNVAEEAPEPASEPLLSAQRPPDSL